MGFGVNSSGLIDSVVKTNHDDSYTIDSFKLVDMSEILRNETDHKQTNDQDQPLHLEIDNAISYSVTENEVNVSTSKYLSMSVAPKMSDTYPDWAEKARQNETTVSILSIDDTGKMVESRTGKKEESRTEKT